MASTGRAPRTSTTGWLLVAGQVALVTVLIAELRHVHRAAMLRCCVGSAVASAGAVIMFVSAAQLGRALHPHPTPTPDAVLRTDGLYRHVRHPMYTGLLLWAAGAALIAGTARAWGAFAALTAVLALKAPYEERQLAGRFPGYPAYAGHTPRFLPRLRPAPDAPVLARRQSTD